MPLIEGATLPEILRRLGGLILAAALSPPALALHRLLVAESARFPEVVGATHAEGATQEIVKMIAGVIARELGSAAPDVKAAEFAAAQFLELVIAIPQRRALGFGRAMSAAERAAWVDATVELFLEGCRGHRPAR